MKGLGLSQSGITDKITVACVVLFALSTLLSFMSIRSEDKDAIIDYEKWAERTFFAALFICTLLSLLIAFDIVSLGK